MRGGGLGLRSPLDLRLPCLPSSLTSAREQVKGLLTDEAFGEYESLLATIEDLFPQSKDPDFETSRQKNVDAVLWEQRFQDLLAECRSPTERACMLAARQPLGYLWMAAIPNPNLGTCVDDVTASMAVGLRLHLPVCLPHVCARCKQEVASDGQHGLHCAFSRGRWYRHTVLNREISASLAKVGMPTLREPSGTHLDPFTRPDGISLVPWRGGKYLAWDVTVASTVAPSYVKDTSLRVGAAATRLEDQKRRKYKDMLQQYIFIPLGLETLGSLGPAANNFLSDLERMMRTLKLDVREFDWLRQRLSLTLVRSNAMSVLGTMSLDGDVVLV